MMNINKVLTMIKLKKLVITVALTVFVTFVMSGCSSMMEGLQSQAEVPTLENQANRVALGMTIVRENNIMAFKMPISADAKWPSMVTADISDEDKKFIEDAILDGPYFSTAHYTKNIQRIMLGSGTLAKQFGDYGKYAAMLMDKTVTPLTYKVIQKIVIFYGNDEENWPNIFNYDGSLDNFLDFKDGKMQDIDSPSGDVYENLGEAVISLTPISLQKDLIESRLAMLESYENVAYLNAQKGKLETKLQLDKDSMPLTEQKKLDLKVEINTIDARIKEAESTANEKEAIYFTLLDDAVVALESDVNVEDKNYVQLAQNINLVAEEIQSAAIEAYASFGLALTNIATNNIVLNFPTELKSLAIAKASVPASLQRNYNKRVERLIKNAVFLLPNIFIGTYYANKQDTLATKYVAITEIIVATYNVKKSQEEAAEEEVAEGKNVY